MCACPSNPVIELTEKIDALIRNHPDAEEAETACALAKELAGLRAKRSLRPRFERRANHSLQEPKASNGDSANGNPTLSD
jgi:hypothetical protein